MLVCLRLGCPVSLPVLALAADSVAPLLLLSQMRSQGGDAGAGAARRGVAASRITRDGLLYLMPLSSAMALRSSSPTQQSLPAFRGSLSSVPSEPATANRTGRPRSSRKLLQPTGADDRWEITSSNGAHTFPYTAVGMITGGCSGVLIGPSTVLTAGHW